MEGDGLWMRCSRCEHVFFQDNPFKTKDDREKPKEESFSAKDVSGEPGRAADEREIGLTSGRDKGVISFLDDVMDAQKGSEKSMSLDAGNIPRGGAEEEKKVEEEDEALDDKEKAGDEDIIKTKQPRKKKGKGWKIFLWSLLVIVVIPAVYYFVINPQFGNRFIEIAHEARKYISDPEPARPEVVIGQIELQNISQRLINNNILGEIRVMQGTALNRADYPVSRILIKGTIIDVNSVALAEKRSYAGNVLSDDELMTFSETEIDGILSRPEGRNNSNDKIEPNEHIPFMIVFAREPPGVIKTAVTIIGAERLL